MKEQEKHAPTPWRVEDQRPEHCPRIIYGPEGYEETVGEVYGAFGKEGITNAEFIVRAVNSHHQLVEALERFLLMFPCGHAIPTADGCVSCGASLALKAAKEPQS